MPDCQNCRAAFGHYPVTGSVEPSYVTMEDHLPHFPKHIVQERLELRAAELHEAAETLPRGGDEREGLIHRARKLESASLVIDRWMASPGLRGPR